MGSTQINHPTQTDEYNIYLKTFDQSFTLELNEKALLTVSCEDTPIMGKILEIDFDMTKSNRLVRALEILLEREGKQLERIYRELENEE